MQIKNIDLTPDEMASAFTDTIDNFQNKFASRKGIHEFIDTYVCYDLVEDVANLYNILKANNVKEEFLDAVRNFVWANEGHYMFNKFLELIGEN